jgi:lipoprotein NlpI
MKPFIKCILLCAVIFFSGCTVKKQVRIDIDKFISDQASYIDEDVVITATLEDVVSRYDLYRGKKNELFAPFSYF